MRLDFFLLTNATLMTMMNSGYTCDGMRKSKKKKKCYERMSHAIEFLYLKLCVPLHWLRWR